jgi:hypothetical protein
MQDNTKVRLQELIEQYGENFRSYGLNHEIRADKDGRHKLVIKGAPGGRHWEISWRGDRNSSGGRIINPRWKLKEGTIGERPKSTGIESLDPTVLVEHIIKKLQAFPGSESFF